MSILEEISTGYRFVRLLEEDAPSTLRIFNEHVAAGFSAYMEEPAPKSFMLGPIQGAKAHTALAAETANGAMVGFGLLRPYSPVPTFRETAVTTIFLSADHTRRGIGSAMLREAKPMSIKRVLAHISSQNPDSVAFHRARGFKECGRFQAIGRKWNRDFDVIWMIKDLSEQDA